PTLEAQCRQSTVVDNPDCDFRYESIACVALAVGDQSTVSSVRLRQRRAAMIPLNETTSHGIGLFATAKLTAAVSSTTEASVFVLSFRRSYTPSIVVRASVRAYGGKAQRICKVDWIVSNIRVEIHSSAPLAFERVFRAEPLTDRVVVARPIVVEAGEAIILPPGELKRIRKGRIRRRRGPERIICILVHHVARPVAGRDRAAY